MNKLSLMAILTTIIVCLTGCGNKNDSISPQELPENFSANTEITYDGIQYEASFARSEGSIWECQFTYPPSMEGMTVTLSPDLCTMEFKGLSYSLKREDTPQFGIVQMVTCVVDDLIYCRNLTCSEENGKLTESGIINGTDFTACFEDDKLITLDISQNFTAKFI